MSEESKAACKKATKEVKEAVSNAMEMETQMMVDGIGDTSVKVRDSKRKLFKMSRQKAKVDILWVYEGCTWYALH